LRHVCKHAPAKTFSVCTITGICDCITGDDEIFIGQTGKNIKTTCGAAPGSGSSYPWPPKSLDGCIDNWDKADCWAAKAANSCDAEDVKEGCKESCGLCSKTVDCESCKTIMNNCSQTSIDSCDQTPPLNDYDKILCNRLNSYYKYLTGYNNILCKIDIEKVCHINEDKAKMAGLSPVANLCPTLPKTTP